MCMPARCASMLAEHTGNSAVSAPTYAHTRTESVVARRVVLSSLDLSCNPVRDAGALCVAELLAQCNMLTSLNLRSASIGPLGQEVRVHACLYSRVHICSCVCVHMPPSTYLRMKG